MVKKIIHISDIHIPNFKRIDEYQEQLKLFIDSCNEKIKPYQKDEVRIVIVGDIVHSKTELSPECYTLVSWFLRQLDDICKTIVIAGNHDITQNLQRLDPLSVIFSMCKFKQTFYLDKDLEYQSGCVIDDNIVWCLYSSFDDFRKPNIFDLKNDNNDKTFVGLFHGELKNSKTDVGFVSENGIDANYFDDIDFCLMGHIHKRQCIKNNGIPCVYSGSLIQQNFGENLSHHGYLFWDVKDCSYDEIDIDNNNYGFYTFQINDIDDIDDDKEEIINL